MRDMVYILFLMLCFFVCCVIVGFIPMAISLAIVFAVDYVFFPRHYGS